MTQAFFISVLSIGFHLLFLLVSAVVIPSLFVVMVVQAPFISRREALRRFRNLIKTYGRLVLRLPYPFVKVSYQDHAGTPHVPCIYICNHRSASDPFLMSLLPGEIVQVVNKWPFRLPVLGNLAKLAGYLSIREMAVESFYEKAANLLGQGVSLAVFPEGTRSASEAMGPFHGAAFRLALQCRVPIVPVCLTGNERIPCKGSFRIYPGHIRIRKLAALETDVYGEMSPFRLKRYVRAIIEQETIRMESFS
jgi:1-acyl-sn-glycerol-3-phosphate acyltransferase